ncbi:CBS domain-containing protein [Pseudonocardiaceae bacterium YIM PH 21723]|nr:CBS domain-containing protein [Pseudonocardiaceae bacterium YIM PH 21723]
MTVGDAMIHFPEVFPPEATVGQVRERFTDDHQHAVLIVRDGELLAVLERPDLAGLPDDLPAARFGRLTDRVVPPDTDLESTRLTMVAERRRRLAVVDPDGGLLGLLCLKRTGLGFCSDEGVRARKADRAHPVCGKV